MQKKYYIKLKKEKGKLFLNENFGVKTIELSTPEDVDDKIEDVISSNGNIIFMSNELASFSNNLVDKYKEDKNIKIIIS